MYFGSQDKCFYALDKKNGLMKWKYDTAGIIHSSAAIDIFGNVYFGSNDGKVYSLTPAGLLRWAYSTGNAVQSSPALSTNGYVYVGSDDFTIYALQISNGVMAWKYKTNGAVRSSVALGKN